MITCSCQHDQPKHRHKKHKQKPVTSSKDTLFVTTRSAVTVWLDTATLEKRRKQYGDDAFYTGSDDDVNYSSIADSVLRSHKLPVINAQGYKYLKFVTYNKSSKIIRVDTLSQIYTLYFFDPLKPLHSADVTDIEDEYYKFYR